jgi:2-C-methyl-D-erythritol 4-phosphate cytidylyltransferase
MSSAEAIAIIVAGGSGSRFGSSVPKQFLPVRGKPLLAHTVERLRSSPRIVGTIIVLPRDDFPSAKERMVPFVGEGVTFVSGGRCRQDSTWEGLSCVEVSDHGLVAVHDGARPLVDSAMIERVVEAAAEHGAAIVAQPVVETLKEVSVDGDVLRTVDRSRLFRAQTPQCFRVDLLRRAFESAMRDGFVGTDEAALVERLGERIRIVEGSEHNIKVTSPEDLARVDYYLSEESKR